MTTEKRLIDANEYKMALEKMREDACATHDWGYEAILDDCIWELDAQTTVDAVEVVRCKDCIHYEYGKGYAPWCNHMCGLDEMGEDDFCSYGERKDNER